jgi:hypothetical protein
MSMASNGDDGIRDKFHVLNPLKLGVRFTRSRCSSSSTVDWGRDTGTRQIYLGLQPYWLTTPHWLSSRQSPNINQVA